MPITAWTRGFGVNQGRVRPVNFLPPSGFFAFAFGSDIPGQVEQLKTGSFHRVYQEGTHVGAKIIRFRGRVRPPAEAVEDSAFKASMLLNGTEVMSHTLVPGWERELRDWAMNVSQISGANEVSWQLELLGTSGAQYEVEMPAFYVDAIALDSLTSGISLVNRIPEPDETQVPLDAPIRVEFMSVNGAAPDLTTVQVYVRGELAFDAGTFQAGYSGSYATSQTHTLRVTITPDDPFESEEVVEVRALGTTTGGAASVDQTYSFTALDMSAPQLATATGVDQKVVRVTFSEPVLQDDGTTAADALNPANYTFERLSHPAVTLQAVSVASVSPTAVDVTVQWPMTPNAFYRITGANLEDLHDNAILAPYDNALFYGYAPPVPAGRDFTLWGRIPKKIQQMDLEAGGVLKLLLDCLQEPIDLMQYEIDRFIDWLDPQTTTDDGVDLMLSDQGNPFEDLDLSYEQKRKLLHVFKSAINLSGSDPGIVNLVRLIMGLDIDVEPYTEVGMYLGEAYLGDPEPTGWILGASGSFARYAFDVISPRVLSDEERRILRRLVNYIKAGWEHFVNLREPGSSVVTEPDHVELGVSSLGENWVLH